MAYAHYERLTALDASFLEIEDENSPMHVGALAIFGPGSLTDENGAVDIDRFRSFSEASLHARYRQRVERMPVTNDWMWVDDPSFNIHYHVRHLGLPQPGDERQLKRLAGQVLSLPLDHKRPLWELWLVEGLEGGRFAVITKAHHCMIDGVGSADLMTASMQLDPDDPLVKGTSEPKRWIPRPAPSPRDVIFGELRRRAEEGGAALEAAREALRDPRHAADSVGKVVSSIREALGASMHSTSPTPLNVEIGPHRRFDWLRFDLDDVKAVKTALGGTINDVVLATVSGALRRFLKQRGEDVDALDFRAMVPVNIRSEEQSGKMGNRVASLAVQLPLDKGKPRGRLKAVIERTEEMKSSNQAAGMEAIEEISDWGMSGLFIQLARFSAVARPFNLVVTNIPGPQVEAFMLGSPLEQVYPLVPLFKNQALGIALFSYDGGLYWGLNADWEAVPDLHDVVGYLAEDFEKLRKAAQA